MLFHQLVTGKSPVKGYGFFAETSGFPCNREVLLKARVNHMAIGAVILELQSIDWDHYAMICTRNVGNMGTPYCFTHALVGTYELMPGVVLRLLQSDTFLDNEQFVALESVQNPPSYGLAPIELQPPDDAMPVVAPAVDSHLLGAFLAAYWQRCFSRQYKSSKQPIALVIDGNEIAWFTTHVIHRLPVNVQHILSVTFAADWSSRACFPSTVCCVIVGFDNRPDTYFDFIHRQMKHSLEPVDLRLGEMLAHGELPKYYEHFQNILQSHRLLANYAIAKALTNAEMLLENCQSTQESYKNLYEAFHDLDVYIQKFYTDIDAVTRRRLLLPLESDLALLYRKQCSNMQLSQKEFMDLALQWFSLKQQLGDDNDILQTRNSFASCMIFIFQSDPSQRAHFAALVQREDIILKDFVLFCTTLQQTLDACARDVFLEDWQKALTRLLLKLSLPQSQEIQQILISHIAAFCNHYSLARLINLLMEFCSDGLRRGAILARRLEALPEEEWNLEPLQCCDVAEDERKLMLDCIYPVICKHMLQFHTINDCIQAIRLFQECARYDAEGFQAVLHCLNYCSIENKPQIDEIFEYLANCERAHINTQNAVMGYMETLPQNMANISRQFGRMMPLYKTEIALLTGESPYPNWFQQRNQKAMQSILGVLAAASDLLALAQLKTTWSTQWRPCYVPESSWNTLPECGKSIADTLAQAVHTAFYSCAKPSNVNDLEKLFDASRKKEDWYQQWLLKELFDYIDCQFQTLWNANSETEILIRLKLEVETLFPERTMTNASNSDGWFAYLHAKRVQEWLAQYNQFADKDIVEQDAFVFQHGATLLNPLCAEHKYHDISNVLLQPFYQYKHKLSSAGRLLEAFYFAYCGAYNNGKESFWPSVLSVFSPSFNAAKWNAVNPWSTEGVHPLNVILYVWYWFDTMNGLNDILKYDYQQYLETHLKCFSDNVRDGKKRHKFIRVLPKSNKEAISYLGQQFTQGAIGWMTQKKHIGGLL